MVTWRFKRGHAHVTAAANVRGLLYPRAPVITTGKHAVAHVFFDLKIAPMRVCPICIETTLRDVDRLRIAARTKKRSKRDSC